MRVFPPTWPIVRRLTLLYALSLFILLGVAAGFLDWVLITDMRKDSDQFLASEMQSFRTLMRQRPADIQTWREEVQREAGSLQGYARYYIRILDEDGGQIVETPGMGNVIQVKAFPPPASAFDVATRNGADVRSSDGRLFLLAAQWVELPKPDARKHLVQVALDRSHDAAILGDYRRKVLIVLFCGLLLSATLGFFIAKAGLKPLSNISKTFKRITADHLHTRVSSVEWPPEIAHLALAFDSMIEGLESSFALLSQFSVDLAHELRTPISNLRGETEVALGKPRTAEEYRNVLLSSLEEYERITRVIENLLFLARTDTHNTAMQPARLNVRQEVDSLIEYFDAWIEEKGITVSATGNALITADPVLFRRALTNLLSNALQYTPQGGRITLTIATADANVEIIMADNGIGIESADLKKVLDRFFRVQQARSLHPEGTGLGLAIVKAIMDLHSGGIAIESSPGQGTSVRLAFPQK